MSNASVDLPEPLTPVTTLNLPRGMSTLRFLRLCSLALTICMAFLASSALPSSATSSRFRSTAAFSCTEWPPTPSLGRAPRHDEAARVAAFRAQVDEPVAGANHVQVVLDDDERVPRIDELAQRAHQLGNVVKVQASGGLVKQEQRAFAGDGLARFGCAARGLGQEACKLEALRLAA